MKCKLYLLTKCVKYILAIFYYIQDVQWMQIGKNMNYYHCCYCIVVIVIFAVIVIIAAIVVIIVDFRVPVTSFQLWSRHVTSLFCCNICITMILIIAISGTAFGNAVSHSQVCNIWFCFWLTGTRRCISTNRYRLWVKASSPWQGVSRCFLVEQQFFTMIAFFIIIN